MSLRAASAVTILLIGFAAPTGSALAQYYPPQTAPVYPPPYSQLPPVTADDDDDDVATIIQPPGAYGQPGLPRPYGQPQAIDPRQVQPGSQYRRGAAYPEATDPYSAPPPGAVYREELPPRGYDPNDPRNGARQDYGSLPAPGLSVPGQPVPGQPAYGQPAYGQPAYGQPAPGQAIPGQQQDAVRPPMSIGPEQQQQPQQQATLSALPPEDRPETGPAKELPPQFRRTLVGYQTKEPAGTIIIDTSNTYLYLVLGGGKAMRYGIGVGREGFTWAGAERVSRMAEWPDWHPPTEMIERQPYLPRFMAGGEGNPLGARALYLGKTLYRIHGTNQPSTIGSFVSSGCIRLTNDDIMDLYTRVQVGSRVVVLPGGAPPATAQATPIAPPVQASPIAPPPIVRTR
jgi:lipoprotein-anchoring transpeptidase ErfK/SrfK